MSTSPRSGVPVHVVGGFLGVGKTTTLRHLLARQRLADERVAVIVNDFGTAGFDASELSEARPGAGGQIIDIPGGCVCCTAPAGLVDAVRGLVEDEGVDRLFIEPTGLARTQDIVDTLRRGDIAARVVVEPLVVVLDPAVLADPAHRALPLLRAQAEAADVLVLNRLDLASPAQLDAALAWVDGLWPGPMETIQTSQGQVPDRVLDWPTDRGPRAPRFRLAPPAVSTDGHQARTLVWNPGTVFHAERLRDALARLSVAPEIARLKGLFRTLDGVFRLEIAGTRVHEGPSPWRRDSRVDVIVAAVGTDAASGALQAAKDALDGAIATAEECAPDPHRVEIVRPDGTRHTLDRPAILGLGGQIADVSTLVPGRAGAAVAVSQVLAAAGVSLVPGLQARVVAADGFATDPVPLTALGTAVLLHSLGGDALDPAKGGPYRLLIPGDAGPGGPCANVKGVVRVVLGAVGSDAGAGQRVG